MTKENEKIEDKDLIVNEEQRDLVIENRKKQLKNQIFYAQPSLLSSDSKVYKSYTGFVNLVVLLLVLTNIRLIFENALKYGILINPQKLHRLFIHGDFTSWPALTCVMSLNIFVLVCYFCEILHSRKRFASSLILKIQFINLVLMIAFPCWLMWVWKPSAGSGLVAMLFICAYHLKMISYTYFNYLYRKETENAKKGDAEDPIPTAWPNNISLKDLYLFILRPTLTYQSKYPTSGPIRWGWILRRLTEMLLLTLLQLGIEEQYFIFFQRKSIFKWGKTDNE